MNETPSSFSEDLFEILSRLSNILDSNSFAWCLASLCDQNKMHTVSDDFLTSLKLKPSVFKNIRATYKREQLLKKLAQIPSFIRLDSSIGLEKELTYLALDKSSLQILKKGFEKLWTNSTQWSGKDIVLRLRFTNTHRTLTVPDIAHTYMSILEILVQKNYQHPFADVDYIFDFGANLGISANFLHDIYPSASFICVEPCSDTFKYLENNLSQNKINVNLIQGVIGNQKGKIVLNKHRTGHLLHSLAFKNTTEYITYEEIDTYTIYDILALANGRKTGIKIDIEGYEHYLNPIDKTFEPISWIIGELHYGTFYSQKGFETLLKRHFNVSFNNPNCRIDFLGQLRVSQDFIAIR